MANENSEIIAAFLKLAHEAEDHCVFAESKQRTEEAKTQDILHKLELDGLNYRERAKLATQLADIRRQRRTYKDEVEAYADIADFVKDNKNFINKLEQLLGKVRKVEKSHVYRKYFPRVLREN